jgi:pSer/pThr/pTyr-binding forkhead associated (FHA) protein
MEFIIGRNKNSQFVIDDSSVSRTHASLTELESNKYLIKNLSTTTTTKVNGTNVFEKIITESDDVLLGEFKLNLKEVFSKFREIKNENQTDFTNEFKVLEDKYNLHIKTQNRIELKYGVIFRYGPGILLLLIGAALQFIYNLQGAMIFTGGLAGISAFVLSKTTKEKEKLDILNNRLDDFWFCPNNKCKVPFRGRTWVGLKDRGRCINHPRCQATW